MVFSSYSFIFYFLPFALTAYFALNNRSWRNVVMLIISILFYSWGEPHYVLLLIGSIIFNWFIALAIHRECDKKKRFLVIGLLVNLLNIGIFKYSFFFFENIGFVFGVEYSLPEIALPIGISFYTFQAISYLIDVYRGTIDPQKNLLYFGSYLGMFPQIMAGPIVRYSSIENEIRYRIETREDFAYGLRRFIIGFSKKIFIANTMGTIADTVLAGEPTNLGAIPAWYAFIAYTFQIYFDFSGYSDMAIGLGRIFGYHFPENFNYPYISRSVTEFWRRWHISLSSFFRDYVYIPLGGNKVGIFRWIVNLSIVWALTGIWHGASWNFILWGLYYGMFLIGEKIVWGRILEKAPNFFQHVYAISIFFFGWVLFRIDSFSGIREWVLALFGFHGLGQITALNLMNVLQYYPWLIIAFVASTPIVNKVNEMLKIKHLDIYSRDVCSVILFVAGLVKLATEAFRPFIYFKF
jgi:alginate O-acetyltransferase complex protein AlgI